MSHLIPRLTCFLFACLLSVPALADDPPTGQQQTPETTENSEPAAEQTAEADAAKQQAEAETQKKAAEAEKQKAEAEKQKAIDQVVERAKDQAMDAAMAAQYDEARKHLKVIEVLGKGDADAEGWSYLVEAQIADSQGNYQESLLYSDEAERLMPDSTAAAWLYTSG